MGTALTTAAILAPLLLSSLACVGAPAPDEATARQGAAEIVPQDSWGHWGIGLNGRALDGSDLGQRALVGVSMLATDAKQQQVRLSLDGSALVVHGHDTKAVVGATLVGQLDDGSSLSIVIDAVAPGTDPTTSDIYFYTASYPTADGDQPLCGVDGAGAPVPAIALAGRWSYAAGAAGGGAHIDDPNAFTLACEGYALAKCAELGYKPWDTIRACPGGQGHCPVVSMADMHQACTRVIRADYCGDGTSYTVDGTEIDIYDAYGYRTPVASWPLEAEWTTQGARCVARLRVPAEGIPTCWANLQDPTCGATSDFASGTILMNQDAH